MNTINYFALTPVEKEYKIDELCLILYRFDPLLFIDMSAEEYNLEALSILPRLSTCHGVVAVQVIIEEEFTYWFGSEWKYNKEFTATEYNKCAVKFGTSVKGNGVGHKSKMTWW